MLSLYTELLSSFSVSLSSVLLTRVSLLAFFISHFFYFSVFPLTHSAKWKFRFSLFISHLDGISVSSAVTLGSLLSPSLSLSSSILYLCVLLFPSHIPSLILEGSVLPLGIRFAFHVCLSLSCPAPPTANHIVLLPRAQHSFLRSNAKRALNA